MSILSRTFAFIRRWLTRQSVGIWPCDGQTGEETGSSAYCGSKHAKVAANAQSPINGAQIDTKFIYIHVDLDTDKWL